jgi:uncharacterized ferredoxin-like protein
MDTHPIKNPCKYPNPEKDRSKFEGCTKINKPENLAGKTQAKFCQAHVQQRMAGLLGTITSAASIARALSADGRFVYPNGFGYLCWKMIHVQ